MHTIPPELILTFFALLVGITGTVIIHYRTKKFDRQFSREKRPKDQ